MKINERYPWFRLVKFATGSLLGVVLIGAFLCLWGWAGIVLLRNFLHGGVAWDGLFGWIGGGTVGAGLLVTVAWSFYLLVFQSTKDIRDEKRLLEAVRENYPAYVAAEDVYLRPATQSDLLRPAEGVTGDEEVLLRPKQRT